MIKPPFPFTLPRAVPVVPPLSWQLDRAAFAGPRIGEAKSQSCSFRTRLPSSPASSGADNEAEATVPQRRISVAGCGEQVGVGVLEPLVRSNVGEMFVADITEVVITGLNANATKLVVESWTLERGLRMVERD
jgi:hypothetical protein